MICGRLPFGDDSQVKAQQKLGLIFPPSRPLSSDAKELIRSVLNTRVKERFDTYDIILHDWTASLPVRVPPPLSSTAKYTLESCIPTIREPQVPPQFTVRPLTPMVFGPNPSGQVLAAAQNVPPVPHHHHTRPQHRISRHATAAGVLAGGSRMTDVPAALLPPLPAPSGQLPNNGVTNRTTYKD